MTSFASLDKSASTLLHKRAAAAQSSVIKRLLQQLALANKAQPLGLSSLQNEAARTGKVGQALKLDSIMELLNSKLSKHHPGFDPAAMKAVATGGPLPMGLKPAGDIKVRQV
jgi:hypothetical protein